MKRMIIVDDHSAFGQALELVLGRTNGKEVVLARTLEEGRTLIRGPGPFDLAVLDIMLPDGDGTELVAEVKRHHPNTPVAILSARDDIAEVALKVGADAAISKATPLPSIISTLERLTG
jgi:two-component system, NtrC family, response regulator PilR